MQYKSQNRVKMMKMKKKNIIRRLYRLVLLLALSFSLYSCKKAGNPSEKEENKASVLSAGEIAGGETEKASESTLKLKLRIRLRRNRRKRLNNIRI